jgi:hypothetical protein
MTTPSLRELQRAFWRGVTVDPSAGPLAVIAPSPALAPVERVGIYAGMYAARVVEALRENFPRTAQVLGAERFDELVRAYLRRHPSTHPSIRYVGRVLPEFLGSSDVAGFVAELARLEWLRLEVFDAADTPVLRREDLAAVAPDDWGTLRFAPVAALATLRTRWAVHRLWKDETRTSADREPTTLRIWRDGFAVYQAPMKSDEARALARMTAGEPFADVCEECDDAAGAAALLLRWIEDGIVARVR